MYKDNLNYRLKHTDLIETIEQMYEGFLLSTIEGRIFYANQAVADISGIPLKDIVGKTPKEMEKAGIIVKQSTKVKSKAPITMIQKLKNGKEIFITSRPIYDEKGSIICFAANYHHLQQLNYLHKLHDHSSQTESRDVVPPPSIQTENWIGESYATNQLKEKVAKVATTEAIVLIQGDSGVGKEVVAKNIHKLSQRKNKPYIQINCGAIPEELIEAELFGYEKGAFTGANSDKEGLFEAANGGTVLLDEIGEMPLHLQVRLLRVIQTKKVTRVGGTKERPLNVRFIAASNKNLQESVDQGEFREDLFYRLNVIPIFIPPLKDRKEDILPLCEYFLGTFNEKYQTKKVLTPETLQLFQEFDWPGNVRQLENIIERLVIITEEDTVSPIFLPDEYKHRHPQVIKGIKPLKEAREQAEINMIQLAINKYGSIRKAAKHLEVDHSTIVRKMKKYHIKEDF
ncbi:sigma-54 interaction domain-containing protein [Salinibacillus xinjiangensis]|uniref:HTH-type transcriptional regulatory protein TyrR n=1 Tax=Salinibacillus xinjiangensis TaxID=1229268 RepID=A0A6G1X994_9BACI|nr:sigma 54-interacting transcriptional regulator [Salinibacillus xinjiangensis]MRG87581.1 AAA domain-containing protein [Salinibacillus xinjiangensis]